MSFNRVTLGVRGEHVFPGGTRHAVSALRRGIVMLHVVTAQEFDDAGLHTSSMDEVVGQVVEHVANRDAGAERVDVAAEDEAKNKIKSQRNRQAQNRWSDPPAMVLWIRMVHAVN